MAHPISWIEVSAQEWQQMADFYQGVFGWPYKRFEEMNYTTADTGEGSVGVGYNQVTEGQPAGSVTVYIDTDDVGDSLDKIKAHGGEVVMEPYPVPTVGMIAMFKDPTGNVLGLIQPEPAAQE
jgi:predicted enzyme related to lactoylglutathione lyase